MIKRRVIALGVAVTVLFTALGFRLYNLSGGMFLGAAEGQGSITVSLGTARGTIYDTRLVPLVNGETVCRIAVAPSGETLRQLQAVLSSAESEAVRLRMEEGRPAVATLGEQFPGALKGAATVYAPVRYGQTVLAQHLIGYVSDGNTGVTGIELAYDSLLSSAAGQATATYQSDGTGMVLSGVLPTVRNTLDQAKAGVVLTVDARVQAIVEEQAGKQLQKGAVVVMRPDTGHILAMASFPTYHADCVAEVLDSTDAPLLNRALANYNLGSVFKVVTAAAALEAGIPTSTAFSCDGALKVGETVFHCHNRLGHGVLDMQSAMAQSCNCYFIQLAQAVGGEALYTMSASLGFDSGLILADGIRTARAVQPAMSELTGAALANFSFGQGDLLATPVHVAQMLSAAVNGGRYVRPTVVRGTVDAAGSVTELRQDAPVTVFSKETGATLMALLRKAVSEGTGSGALPEKGGAGGKTGTAETGWVIDGHTVSQSWFAGFFPAYAPQYVVVVLSEDVGQTGVKAAGVFRNICEALYEME